MKFAVPYYGPAPDAVIEMLKNTQAAILAHYAETDNDVNASRDKVKVAMEAAGKELKQITHPGTMHAFNNDTGARYNETAAVNAWKETLAWFERLKK